MQRSEPPSCSTDTSSASDRRLVVIVVVLVAIAIVLIVVIGATSLSSAPSQTAPGLNHAYMDIGHPFSDWLPGMHDGSVDDIPSFPRAWLPTRGDECHEYRGLHICEGPRMAPEPHGEAARLARELGLGGRPTASMLLRQRPPVDWILAVQGEWSDMFYWPIEGGHGENIWRGLIPAADDGSQPAHNGVDIGAYSGTRIRAVADGLVAYSDNELSGYGNMMIVIHVDGSIGLYAHCRANYVFPGQQVRAGQIIGEVGETGITHGAHLHFELREKGEPKNPLPFFRRWLEQHDRPDP